jgi:hypothetical protein
MFDFDVITGPVRPEKPADKPRRSGEKPEAPPAAMAPTPPSAAPSEERGRSSAA